jgi:hypothetical protein
MTDKEQIMETQNDPTLDIISAAIAGEPVSVRSAFDAAIAPRMAAAIDGMTPDIARGMFASGEPE